MYALIDANGKLERVEDNVDYQQLVLEGYNIIDCDDASADIGKICSNGVYSPPSPYHTAMAGVWVLTGKNREDLKTFLLEKLLELPPSKLRNRLYTAVAKNPTKAYYLWSLYDNQT